MWWADRDVSCWLCALFIVAVQLTVNVGSSTDVLDEDSASVSSAEAKAA